MLHGDGVKHPVPFPPMIRSIRLTLTSFLDAFSSTSCLTRGAALSFTTILSLIPFLAFAFAILKGFDVPNRLEPLLLQNVAAGQKELVERIITYINNTNMKSLGTVGLVTLIFTVVSLIGEIEEAFNAIWGVTATRSLGRKITDYISMVVVGPILLTAATSITTTLQSQELVRTLLENDFAGPVLLSLFRFVPFVSITAALTFAYSFLPNAPVRLKSALLGGCIAGVIWQTAQWGYLHLQIYMTSYNAIYGTMAVLPIFMIWVYTSWIIVLSGMLLVRRHQLGEWSACRCDFSPSERERIALAVVRSVLERFESPDLPPADMESLSRDLPTLSRSRLEETVEFLVNAGILCRSGSSPSVILPAHDPSLITVGDLLERLHSAPGNDGGEPLPELPPTPRVGLDPSVASTPLSRLPATPPRR